MKIIDKIVAVMVAIAVIPAIMLIVNNTNYENMYVKDGFIVFNTTYTIIDDEYLGLVDYASEFESTVFNFDDYYYDIIIYDNSTSTELYFIGNNYDNDPLYGSTYEDSDGNFQWYMDEGSIYTTGTYNEVEFIAEYVEGDVDSMTAGYDLLINFYNYETVELENSYNFLIAIIPLIFVAGIIVVIRSKK